MSVSRVKAAASRALSNDGANKIIDKAEAKAIIDAAGSSVSKGEQRAIVDAFSQSGVTVKPDALQLAREQLSDIVQARAYAKKSNDQVKDEAPALAAEEKALRAPGVETHSFAGSVIPEAVKEAVRQALEAGAEPYDVRQLEKNPEQGDHGEGFTVGGVFSPYPQSCAATDSMAFGFTEITPDKIKQQMETEQTYMQLTGLKTETYTDPRSGKTESYQVGEYKQVTAKGSGNIHSHYDEAQHPETKARDRDGAQWANNYAILADGTLHALPAMRRSADQPNLILTNPSLARGKRMLFNGHIEMSGGVVTRIGMSGRIQKLASKGEHKFVNPVNILKAWGFKMSPNLQVSFEGRSARPPVDPDTGVIG